MRGRGKKKCAYRDERFVVLDFETTGLRPLLGDEICEYALVEIVAGEAGRHVAELVKPSKSMPEVAAAVHGITDEMLADCRPFDEALPEFLAFVDDATLVMHNAGFDMGFLQARLAALELPPLRNLTVDTLELSRRHRADSTTGHRLIDVVRAFGITEAESHRALGDAEMTARVFLRFAEELGKDGAEVTLERLGARRHPPSVSPAVLRDIAEELRRAIDEKKMVEIVYASRAGGERRRRLEPEVLAAFHVEGYCHLKKTRLRFRLDRIRSIETLDEVSRG